MWEAEVELPITLKVSSHVTALKISVKLIMNGAINMHDFVHMNVYLLFDYIDSWCWNIDIFQIGHTHVFGVTDAFKQCSSSQLKYSLLSVKSKENYPFMSQTLSLYAITGNNWRKDWCNISPCSKKGLTSPLQIYRVSTLSFFPFPLYISVQNAQLFIISSITHVSILLLRTSVDDDESSPCPNTI